MTLKLKSLITEDGAPSNIHTMTDNELIGNLVTVDFKGKDIKRECLDELIKRAESRGFKAGYEAARKGSE